DPAHPMVTLIGEGVCFDTGGLDIKSEASRLNMKKDMGGAATLLALAHMLMGHGAKLRLRVLIPAVENSIAGSAFRPRDVYRSRKGITVEIGNTDAEGRLILADALALADEEAPELIADMATLTGAARVALGPELAPFYTGDEALAANMARHARAEQDPVWRMPLWRPYESMLDSKIADINKLGERITIYEMNDEGWAWGQLVDDGYVGWLPANALLAPREPPTHRVRALRTLAFPGPSIKLPPVVMPPLGSRLAVSHDQDCFAV